ncbi:MAG TPA: alpha/beta hydrolase-fold protein [Phycisphaerales bacterium]|nr:alpha/beta hydrolase-fold protein [Phycisphaerales bacterium]
MRILARSFAVLFACIFAVACRGQNLTPVGEWIHEAIVIGDVGRGGRSAVHTDAVEAMIVRGEWRAPAEGDAVTLPNGDERRWERIAANDDGWFAHAALRNGYARLNVRTMHGGLFVLEASGHSMVYVNGQPRAGDPYQTGYVRLPIALRPGDNELLFVCARGRLRARVTTPPSRVFFDTGDLTLPSLVQGEGAVLHAGVVVVNTDRVAARERTVRAEALASDGTPLAELHSDVGILWPHSTRKVPIDLPAVQDTSLIDRSVRYRLTLENSDDTVLATTEITLDVRTPDEQHDRTFISGIDGSVQYYSVRPGAIAEGATPGLILTLHGASVEARGQAACYAPKDWAHVVAPTNRRPYGFDWEDWGRLDAMEVLGLASARFGTDPRRTIVTGHSMGGHGSWHLGVTFPGRWAAIGPSAGWVSFWSYTGAARYEAAEGVEAILMRATSPSDTLALTRNLDGLGVYVLHGDADDNVPVEQARTMRRRVGEWHRDFEYHEQPGAGHWWGNECVDWGPMVAFFKGRARDEAPARVTFATASPGVSATRDWVTIEQQHECLKFSRVDATIDAAARRVVVATENVARLALDLRAVEPGGRIVVEIDGREIDSAWPEHGVIHLMNGASGEGVRGRGWSVASPLDAAYKGPHRSGPFKAAFDNRFVFVVGTLGSEVEMNWAFAKARYDAETWWYRGNGSVEIVPDRFFDPAAEPDRSVIVYGNADTVSCWDALLGDAPVRVTSAEVRVGERVVSGDDLAVLFCHPRPGSERAMVGVVSGTGLAGRRLTDRLPYFVSGVQYPDWIVLDATMLERGVQGVMGAGFFGNAWEYDTRQSAWRDAE